MPNTTAEWLEVAKDFNESWNMPHVLGAMDGKHIVFQAPRSSGSTFYNYKGQHSIVLLAVVDAKYRFLYIDVGVNGRVSDGGVFKQSDLAKAIELNTLNIPRECPLPSRELPVPFVFVADAAFPLSQNILKPFPLRNLTYQQRIFNYRLSRARRVVENAFGILANRFRILLTSINLCPEKVQAITLASCALHNFLMTECPNYTFCELTEVDEKLTFNHGLQQQAGNRPKRDALDARDEFMAYLTGAGRVEWQDQVLLQ